MKCRVEEMMEAFLIILVSDGKTKDVTSTAGSRITSTERNLYIIILILYSPF
jgi:hypothetical protein